MFVAVYKYLLTPEKTKKYIMLEKQAIQIYLEHGCLGLRSTGTPRTPGGGRR